MNRYRLDEFLKSEFAPYQSTFKDTSYDSINNVHLCTDETVANVYDFDAYVAAKFGGEVTPASPDAIFLGPKDLYFIEFKNQRWKDVNRSQLERKFIGGTRILKELLADFQPRDIKRFLCVVHKPDPSERAYRRGVDSACLRFAFDGLNANLGGFYDEVFVRSVEFYRQQFCELNC